LQDNSGSNVEDKILAWGGLAEARDQRFRLFQAVHRSDPGWITVGQSPKNIESRIHIAPPRSYLLILPRIEGMCFSNSRAVLTSED
jgi:hypothetical protein